MQRDGEAIVLAATELTEEPFHRAKGLNKLGGNQEQWGFVGSIAPHPDIFLGPIDKTTKPSGTGRAARLEITEGVIPGGQYRV
jgi:hypothetical protein